MKAGRRLKLLAPLCLLAGRRRLRTGGLGLARGDGRGAGQGRLDRGRGAGRLGDDRAQSAPDQLRRWGRTDGAEAAPGRSGGSAGGPGGPALAVRLPGAAAADPLRPAHLPRRSGLHRSVPLLAMERQPAHGHRGRHRVRRGRGRAGPPAPKRGDARGLDERSERTRADRRRGGRTGTGNDRGQRAPEQHRRRGRDGGLVRLARRSGVPGLRRPSRHDRPGGQRVLQLDPAGEPERRRDRRPGPRRCARSRPLPVPERPSGRLLRAVVVHLTGPLRVPARPRRALRLATRLRSRQRLAGADGVGTARLRGRPGHLAHRDPEPDRDQRAPSGPAALGDRPDPRPAGPVPERDRHRLRGRRPLRPADRFAGATST